MSNFSVRFWARQLLLLPPVRRRGVVRLRLREEHVQTHAVLTRPGARKQPIPKCFLMYFVRIIGRSPLGVWRGGGGPLGADRLCGGVWPGQEQLRAGGQARNFPNFTWFPPPKKIHLIFHFLNRVWWTCRYPPATPASFGTGEQIKKGK